MIWKNENSGKPNTSIEEEEDDREKIKPDLHCVREHDLHLSDNGNTGGRLQLVLNKINSDMLDHWIWAWFYPY